MNCSAPNLTWGQAPKLNIEDDPQISQRGRAATKEELETADGRR
jgi:hypothetical protein